MADPRHGGGWLALDLEVTELAYHACCAPDVSRGAILSTNQHLHGPVLPSLNVLGEVFVLEEKGTLGAGALVQASLPHSPHLLLVHAPELHGAHSILKSSPDVTRGTV